MVLAVHEDKVVPKVSTQVVRSLLHIVERAGIPGHELLRADMVDDGERDRRVPLSVVDRICEQALELTGDAALGLHWAERLSHLTFGPVTYLASYAASMRHAIESVMRFAAVFVDYPFLELRETGEWTALRAVSPAARSADMRRISAEMFVGGMVDLARALRTDARFERIAFQYPRPDYHEEYTRVLGQAPLFDQPFTEIVVARSLFDAPSQHRDDELSGTLAQLAERRLSELLHQQAPFSLRAHEYLIGRAPTRVNMPAVAHALGVSVRSLRRRLQDEGTTYLAVEYDAMASVATGLLRDPRSSIKEVAHRMGFSDVTTFHRAFKRWTGTTPSSFSAQPR